MDCFDASLTARGNVLPPQLLDELMNSPIDVLSVFAPAMNAEDLQKGLSGIG